MKRSLIRTPLSIFLLATLMGLMTDFEAKAQAPLYMDIGSFHAAFAADFYESYEFARNIHPNKYGLDNWLFWPAEYTWENGNDAQALLGAFGIYLALPNFTDKKGEHHNYYHAAVWGDRGPYGDRIKEAYTVPPWPGIPSEPASKRYRKWADPTVKVGISERPKENKDEIKFGLVSEMMVETMVHSEMGITVTRRASGWSQQDHDDYLIVEFILENTGYVMEKDPSTQMYTKATKPSGWAQPLDNVWFALCYRFQPSALGCQQNGNWGDRLLSGKGNDAQHIYIGETYGQPGQRAEDSLRALISWDGDADAAAIREDDTGNPHVLTGVLLSPQYVGISILHADESPHAKGVIAADDPTQPKTTMWRGSTPDGYAFDQTEWDPPDDMIYNYISSRQYQESPEAGGETRGGLDNLGEEHGYFLGFGPYNFQPNETVRIVTAYAAGGISRHRAIEVGRQWEDGDITTNEKNAILATGRDSLMAAFSKAKLMYEKTDGLNNSPEDILPPPPPVSFTVTSDTGQVRLEWDGMAPESAPDFAGYRLYRNYRSAIPINHPGHPRDTLYTKIWECGEGTAHPEIVNSFIDTDVRSLWTYRYYLTAFDTDGNESGRFYTLMQEGVDAQPGWVPYDKKPLKNVMVIPNPAINKAYQWNRRIMFVNLPDSCTIKIYTQSGNLVQVIEHPRYGAIADGDEEWNQDTISNQRVTSGIYVYTVESKLGNTMGTLVIIR
jgi:hypothetical protein